MRAWHRIFLSFLLAVALPVQGWAASTMLWCASTPAHHASSTAAGPATDAHAHHHVQTPADAAGSADAAADATATTDAGSLGKCSACAACCIGVAILPSHQFTPMLPIAASYGLIALAPPARIALDGLERPPRSSLA